MRTAKITPKLLGGVLIAAASLADVSMAEAADANVRCVQAFLEFKGLDPGPLDGAAGSRTFAAAAQYKADTGITIDDLSADTAAAWCEYARSDEDFGRLLAFSYGTESLWRKGVQSNRNYDQVLVADSVGNFEQAERSIQKPGALSFIDLNDGLVAARISVNYEDEGHREDWFYNDRPGVQQRFELTERRAFSMKPNKTYWLRISVYIPEGVDVGLGDQLVMTDLKPMVNGLLFDPVMELKISNNHLQLNHLMGRKQDCVIGFNESGGENTYCDVTKEQLYFAMTSPSQRRWINFVYRVHWANDDTGTFHLWRNDKLIAGLKGDTLHGAEYITNKFGIYRGYYHTQGTPQPDATLYFAGIGRSETCEGLGLANCAALEADVEQVAKPGVIKTNLVEETGMTDYLAAGGRVMQGAN